MALMETADTVLAYWLGDPPAPQKKWFSRSDAVDDEIRARFGETLEAAARGELDAWASTPRGRVALVIVLDQLSRNAFRGSARSFAQDARAAALALEAIASGEDHALGAVERHFLYMPLMHAEDRVHQETGVGVFDRLASDETAPAAISGAVKYARMHRDIVARFGRFPHRNALLGRASTQEEIAFLKEPGSSF
jgi:uncharacterized protein (DUF924 family)